MMRISVRILLIFLLGASAMHPRIIQKISTQDHFRKLSIILCHEENDRLLKEINRHLISFKLHKPRENSSFDDFISSIISEYNQIVTINFDCQNELKIFDMRSKATNLFKGSLKWLFVTKSLNKTITFLMEQNINIDSKIMIVVSENQINYQIYYVRAPALQRNGVIEVKQIGKFTNNDILFKDPWSVVHYAMNETQLTVTTCIPEVPKGIPFVEYATSNRMNNKYTIARFPLKIILLISELYNFRVHLKRSPEYGMLIKNSSRWSGLLGMLHRQEADIAGQSLFYVKARMPVMDSGLSVFKYRQSFIFRHPKYATNQKNIFLMPLHETVWLCILGISILVVIALYSIFKQRSGRFEESSLVLIAVYMIGLLAQQGFYTHYPRSVKAKTVILFSLILSFVCFQFYSASIVSSLLTPPVRSITSMPKLTSSQINIILEDHPSSRLVFKINYDPDLSQIYEKKVKGQEKYMSIEKGLSMVKTGPYAYLITVDEVADMIKSNFTHSEIQELQEISIIKQDHRALIYIPLSKGSPFNELIRVGVLKVTEVGLRNYHMKSYIVNVTDKIKNSYSTAVVDFERTSSIFYFLMGGYLICLIILLCEIVLSKVKIHLFFFKHIKD